MKEPKFGMQKFIIQMCCTQYRKVSIHETIYLSQIWQYSHICHIFNIFYSLFLLFLFLRFDSKIVYCYHRATKAFYCWRTPFLCISDLQVTVKAVKYSIKIYIDGFVCVHISEQTNHLVMWQNVFRCC